VAKKREVVFMTKEQKNVVIKCRNSGLGCSAECRKKWWKEPPEMLNKKAVYSYTCAGCGRRFTAYGNFRRKYCSHEGYIKDRFKGGGADD